MGVNARCTVPALASARSTGNSLVIAPSVDDFACFGVFAAGAECEAGRQRPTVPEPVPGLLGEERQEGLTCCNSPG
jgi:hypothetical protein